jgi:hypothetical protein
VDNLVRKTELEEKAAESVSKNLLSYKAEMLMNKGD